MSGKERKPMKACIAIGGVALVHPTGHPQAGEVVEFDVAMPGEYTVTFGRLPRCFVYRVSVGEEDFRFVGEEDLRVEMTLAGVGRLEVASIVWAPARDPVAVRRAWDVLFEETVEADR